MEGQSVLAGPFWRLKKVPRCKSETIIPATTHAGYTPKTKRQRILLNNKNLFDRRGLIRERLNAEQQDYRSSPFANEFTPT
jgi:hypothetical protein